MTDYFTSLVKVVFLQKLKVNWPSRFERSVLLITHRKDCAWCNYRRKTQYFTLQYLVCLTFQFSVAWSRTWPNVPSPPRVWCVTLSVALQPCFFLFQVFPFTIASFCTLVQNLFLLWYPNCSFHAGNHLLMVKYFH